MAPSSRPEGRKGVPIFQSPLKSRPAQNLYFSPPLQNVSVRPTSNVGTLLIRSQCCPVNLRGLGQKANSGGAFRVTWGVSDLNRKWSFALAFRVFASPESP